MSNFIADNAAKYFKATLLPIDLLEDIMDGFGKKRNPENPGANKIHDHYKSGGQCDAWACDNSVVKNMDKKLSEANIDHACIHCAPGDTNAGKGVVFLITKGADRSEILRLKDEVLKEIGARSNIPLQELKRNNIGERLYNINNVTPAYKVVFQEESKKVGLEIAITDNKNGTYNLHFAERDRDAFQPIIKKTIESTKGATGLLNEMRIEREMNTSKELFSNIANPNSEFYVIEAAQPKEYMHFKPEGYQYVSNERILEDRLRSNNNFQQDAHIRVAGSFVCPVVASKEEFKTISGLSIEERRAHLMKKVASIKSVSPQTKHHLELERLSRELMEKKLALDNNSLNVINDPTVQYSSFESREFTTDRQLDRAQNVEDSLTLSRDELPADAQNLVSAVEDLSYEDRKYMQEYMQQTKLEIEEIERSVIVSEITYDEIYYDDIDMVIANTEYENKETTERTDNTEHVERSSTTTDVSRD